MAQLKDLTVFIGRFSLFHNGHAVVLKRALETSKVVLVLVGSSGTARNTKNPFTFDERKLMIEAWAHAQCYSKANPLMLNQYGTLVIEPIYDHPYNDQLWIREVQGRVSQVKERMRLPGVQPFLTGANRDETTWYLSAFGSFFREDFIKPDESDFSLSATGIRATLFSLPVDFSAIKAQVPDTTLQFINAFSASQVFDGLCKEFAALQRYKAQWAGAPFPPIFQTVDAVVVQSGHVLLVVRGDYPGKGLWALPGGFLNQYEKLIDGCIRELKEETRIELSPAMLRGAIKHREVFDNPGRSLRGRTITTAFLFRPDDSKPLPAIKGSDDAESAEWVPIEEALSQPERFFEDHHAIIETMTAVKTA